MDGASLNHSWLGSRTPRSFENWSRERWGGIGGRRFSRTLEVVWGYPCRGRMPSFIWKILLVHSIGLLVLWLDYLCLLRFSHRLTVCVTYFLEFVGAPQAKDAFMGSLTVLAQCWRSTQKQAPLVWGGWWGCWDMAHLTFRLTSRTLRKNKWFWVMM